MIAVAGPLDHPAVPAVEVTALRAPPELQQAFERAHALEGIEVITDER